MIQNKIYHKNWSVASKICSRITFILSIDLNQKLESEPQVFINIFLNSSFDFGFSSSSSRVPGLLAVHPSGLTFLGTANVFFPLSWMFSMCLRPLDPFESSPDSLDTDLPWPPL